MKGIIVANGFAYTPNARFQAERLRDELLCLGVDVRIVFSDEVAAIIDGGMVRSPLNDISFCVYFDKDLHISRSLSKLGIRLFNSSRAIELCDDKMLTYIELANNDIPMPKTVSSPLCYSACDNQRFLSMVAEELAFPMVVKECFGSMGQQVYLANDLEELKAIRARLINKPHLYQQFIEESKGCDMRVIVVGKKVVAAMLRTSKTDFRSNIELGGEGKSCDISKEFEKVAIKAATLLGLDYCGVDLLISNDKPILCEVNSNAYFKKMEEVSNVNIAGLYAKHIVAELQSIG